MPELPEVEVVLRGLRPHLLGKTITGVNHSGKHLRVPVPFTEMAASLPGRKVVDIRRRAKYLIILFDNGMQQVIHLGMTGKIGIFATGAAPQPHDHVVWHLDGNREMRFNDVRRFGSLHLLKPDEADDLEKTVIRNTGPEPFDPSFNGSYLYKKAQGKSKPVKSFIMDNSTVAGIGNIYANESLYAAGIRPTKPCGRVSKKKWQQLTEEIRKVLLFAIECGGSTISDFLGASGEQGYFQINFKVYGKKDMPCPCCSTPLKQVKIGGRASFFCPRCQH